MATKPVVVGIGGTTRANSSTEKALRFALGVAEKEGAETILFGGPTLEQLPHYAPEKPERCQEARDLVEAIRRSDGVVVATPGYHGTISGMVKNALDYTEDMREDAQPYFTGRPVGCIATGAGWQGTVSAMEALRSVVHALRGWPTPLGAAINTSQPTFSPDGEPIDERVTFQLTTVAQDVMQFIRWRRGEG
ncbi:MAG: NAD(P)H-dependent oxidoreductase [Actinobacteria bacterium]|nr:MAG: NAD(P)H-dependent oxidoreductase [Actinomycetota bacterium]